MTADRYEVRQGQALAILADIDDSSADAVITDPPYSSGGQFRGDRANTTGRKYVQSNTVIDRPDFAGDNRDQHGYQYWCALWLAEALRATRPSGSLLVFTDWRQLAATTDAVQAGGWVWRGVIPWDKGEGVRPRRGGFSAQCEFVIWATAGEIDDSRELYLHGMIRVPVRQSDKHHQTGKPTDLMRRLVQICPPGGLVLDPFAGSGTTGVAALLEGRRFLGVELLADYCHTARNRLDQVLADETAADAAALAILADGPAQLSVRSTSYTLKGADGPIAHRLVDRTAAARLAAAGLVTVDGTTAHLAAQDVPA